MISFACLALLLFQLGEASQKTLRVDIHPFAPCAIVNKKNGAPK
jgi:hypothetical protein